MPAIFTCLVKRRVSKSADMPTSPMMQTENKKRYEGRGRCVMTIRKTVQARPAIITTRCRRSINVSLNVDQFDQSRQPPPIRTNATTTLNSVAYHCPPLTGASSGLTVPDLALNSAAWKPFKARLKFHEK